MKKSYLCILTAALLLASSLAGATMVMPSSVARMTASSDAIVIGTIGPQAAQASGGAIFTDVTVNVSEFLKAPDAARPQTITVRVPGGTSGEQSMKVDMAPAFTPGEKVLLFLKRSGARYVTYGFYYGVVRISEAGGQTPDQVGGPLFQTGQVYDFTEKKMVLNTVPLGGEKLDAFKNRINAALTAGAE